MDIAYDHISEETFASDRASTPTPQNATASASKPNLNTEFQETFRALSNSPWGAKLGGLWGNVCKQSEHYYEGARREVEGAGGEALKGFADLKDSIVKQTKTLSLDEKKSGTGESSVVEDDTTSTAIDSDGTTSKKRTESETIRQNESLISKFRSEAAKRLKDIEKAEDAADEALLRFGTNIRNFLHDAVAIAPPSQNGDQNKNSASILFESKDSAGKRVIHTTRFDAQLHVIHSSSDSFTKDPVSGEWSKFRENFRIDERTDDISQNLEKYPELKRDMEQLVPEKVDYTDFWCRYYFLRLVIETEEEKRRELLRGASQSDINEDIAWDADSDDDEQQLSSRSAAPHKITLTSCDDTGSTTTISQPSPPSRPTEGRKSHDQYSQADSDASYDLVSRAGSRTPGSPKEAKDRRREDMDGKKSEESDEEDWE